MMIMSIKKMPKSLDCVKVPMIRVNVPFASERG